MPLYNDQLLSDTADIQPPDSPLVATPSSSIGGGPASTPPVTLPTAGSRVSNDLQNLPTLNKVGLALQSFGAGVLGQPNPIDVMQKQKRDERMAQLSEFRVHISSLEDGIKMSERLRGADREAFAASYASRLDEVSPGLGDTFKNLAKRPDITKMLGKYSDIPMAQISLQTDPSGQNFLKLLSTTEGIKMAEKQLDMKALPVVTQKVKIMAQNWQQLVPKEMADKFNEDGVLSESEILKANDYIKEKYPKLALDDAQMEVLGRNSDAVFAPLGIMTSKTEQGVLASGAKAKEKLQPGQITELPLGGKGYAKAAYDPDGTLFPDAEHDSNGFAILGKGTKEGTTINFPSSSGFGVNPDTEQTGHYTIGKDGDIRWDKVKPAPKETNPIQKAIADIIKNPSKGAKPAASAGQTPTQADRDYVKAHPEFRQKFIDTFRVNP